MRRRAAVAGGGIAGMAAAGALARHGFEVCVHERAPGLRELGAGIYLKENSLRVLDQLDVYERLEARAVRLAETRLRTEGGRLVLTRRVARERTLVALREDLHALLTEAAEAAGAEIRTRSRVETAAPSGALTLQGGREADRPDLVVGADGLHSRVRTTAGIDGRVRILADGATRLLIPRTETQPVSTEHWSGRLRVGVTPCSPDQTYVFLIGPESDEHARRLPVDTEYWLRSFPYLGEVFERVVGAEGTHHPHALVECSRWTRGRIALVGDAAHAQPPNLGQGAGLAIANAWALARTLQPSDTVEAGLAAWEAQNFPLSRRVQRWSHRYGLAGHRWPPRLHGARTATLWVIGHSPYTRDQWAWLWRGGVSDGDQPARSTWTETA
ncbi:MAG TPA: FAD-dependent monooxygenase [Solirubrobacteraceae bacterium]|nr:FAD-dependent monooxygenase [Solirubrobacteraceae bacterium]